MKDTAGMLSLVVTSALVLSSVAAGDAGWCPWLPWTCDTIRYPTVYPISGAPAQRIECSLRRTRYCCSSGVVSPVGDFESCPTGGSPNGGNQEIVLGNRDGMYCLSSLPLGYAVVDYGVPANACATAYPAFTAPQPPAAWCAWEYWGVWQYPPPAGAPAAAGDKGSCRAGQRVRQRRCGCPQPSGAAPACPGLPDAATETQAQDASSAAGTCGGGTPGQSDADTRGDVTRTVVLATCLTILFVVVVGVTACVAVCVRRRRQLETRRLEGRDTYTVSVDISLDDVKGSEPPPYTYTVEKQAF